MIKVKVWADFVCPYSYIGVNNLQVAIERLQLTDVDIQYASYLKYPFIQVNATQSLPLFLSDKYGISEDEAQDYMEQVAMLAEQNSLLIQLQQLRPINTFTVHRLSKLAASHQLQQTFYHKMFQAYFLEGFSLNNQQQLMQLCVEIGLPIEQVHQVFLNSALFESEVEEDQFEAQRLGIEGVPYFIVNNTYKIVGVQSVQQFEEVLDSIDKNV